MMQSLGETLRVIWAAFVRDRQTALSYRTGFLLSIVASVVNILGVFFLSRAFGTAGSGLIADYGGNYFSFAIVGIAFTNFMALGLGGIGGRVREGQMMGTLELMLLSPNRLGVLLLSSALWSHVVSLGSLLLYFLAGALLGVQLGQANVPMAVLSLALAIISFNALGLLAASFVIVLKQGNPVTWVIGTASVLLSGVFYPTNVLPDWLRGIGQLLPLTQALELLRRSILNGEGLATLWPPFLALLLLTVVLLPVGLVACHLAVRVAQTDGSLSQY
jgi:ABC-2 type transport system permease protein